jgi:serine/threonine-protein kinase ULK/ATG1
MISDFGFARFLNSTPNMEEKSRLTILGSPLYMSPQLLREDKFFSSKCDVWSLGIVLYQMIFGKLPWVGESSIEIYQNIMQKDLQFPPTPEVPNQVNAILFSFSNEK